jgi:glycine/D-amino acid oxidase-like deaminating enzyme
LGLKRRWKADSPSPFERVRTMDPACNPVLNQNALDNLKAAWPAFDQARVAEAWAGLIDVTPDSIPVIDQVAAVPGLVLATGFSGHGFGTGPAAGQLAADLLSGVTPIIDPSPYRFARF